MSRTPFPTLSLLAIVSPVIVVVGAIAVREVGGPDLLPDWRAIVLLLLATMAPAVLLAFASRHAAQAAEQERRLQAALAALERAERTLASQAAALARVESMVAAGSSARPRAAGARALVLILILLAAGGLVVATQVAPDVPELVHHHPSFAVFVEGERVSFAAPGYGLAARGYLRAHLHPPDDEIIHIEGPAGVTLGTFFDRTLGSKLLADRLVLVDAAGPHAFISNATHQVRVFVATGTGEFVEQADPAAIVPGPADRILVTFTNGHGLQAEMAAVRPAGQIGS